MKNKFLNFLKRYYILIILSLLHPCAMATTVYWGRIFITESALGPFRTYDLYVIFLIPILYFIYGCVAYIMTKKVFISNIIPTVIFLIYFGISVFKDFEFSIEKFYAMLFFVLFPIAFSMLGTLVTVGVYKIKKFIKKSVG